MSDPLSDLDILTALDVDLTPEPERTYTAEEARIIAGFEDIERFVAEHGRVPSHGSENDIFERLYAVRLDRLRENEIARDLLAAMDVTGLLNAAPTSLSDDAIINALGDEDVDITRLKHVAPVAHRNAASEIAGRDVCRDFDTYAPIFESARNDLKLGRRESRTKIRKADFAPGTIFIVNGQMALIASKGEEFESPSEGTKDAKMLVVYDNGTESRNLLMRSLQRALNKDKTGRVISKPDAGPLFGNVTDTDTDTGTVYVLRSLSDAAEIADIRDAIIKIGVTGGDVKKRIANAENEATYLLGKVQIVDEYKLFNINRIKMERLLQNMFREARLEITVKDRFGKPVKPSEWFLVPPAAVAEAVSHIKKGTAGDVIWNAEAAEFQSFQDFGN